MSCNCESCILIRNWNAAKEQKNIALMDDLFNDLFSMYEHAQLDGEVLQAVMDGEWPNSIKRLEHALVKAKKIEAEKQSNEA